MHSRAVPQVFPTNGVLAAPADNASMQRSTDPLPDPYRRLVDSIGANSPEAGGANRQAMAELQARLALAQDRTAARLTVATWALVLATVALLVVTGFG